MAAQLIKHVETFVARCALVPYLNMKTFNMTHQLVIGYKSFTTMSTWINDKGILQVFDSKCHPFGIMMRLVMICNNPCFSLLFIKSKFYWNLEDPSVLWYDLPEEFWLWMSCHKMHGRRISHCHLSEYTPCNKNFRQCDLLINYIVSRFSKTQID